MSTVDRERASRLVQRILAEGSLIERESGEFFCKCGSPDLSVFAEDEGVSLVCTRCGNAIQFRKAE